MAEVSSVSQQLTKILRGSLPKEILRPVPSQLPDQLKTLKRFVPDRSDKKTRERILNSFLGFKMTSVSDMLNSQKPASQCANLALNIRAQELMASPFQEVEVDDSQREMYRDLLNFMSPFARGALANGGISHEVLERMKHFKVSQVLRSQLERGKTVAVLDTCMISSQLFWESSHQEFYIMPFQTQFEMVHHLLLRRRDSSPRIREGSAMLSHKAGSDSIYAMCFLESLLITHPAIQVFRACEPDDMILQTASVMRALAKSMGMNDDEQGNAKVTVASIDKNLLLRASNFGMKVKHGIRMGRERTEQSC